MLYYKKGSQWIKQLRHEYLVYLVVWCLLLVLLLASLYLCVVNGANIIDNYGILAVVLLVLMFCAYVGIKGYRHSRRYCLWVTDLEKQLEYTVCPISPQFFMNALTNIYTLIDTNPEKGKNNIRLLSKIIRYLLYGANKPRVHLYYELDFIRHYVTLMKLRYDNEAKITLDLPLVPDRQIAPLILVTFIENAFKYGISSKHESFIEIKAHVEDDKLYFTCRNSKAENKSSEQKQDLGIDNLRKRINMIYEQDYSLRIDETPDTYSVEIVISLN